MAWVKLDDHIDEHPKIARLDNDAFSLFVCGLAYCNRNLTDGFIPRQVGLGQLRYCASGTSAAVGQLEEVGLWEPQKDGWMVHDYDEYQPSKDAVLSERERGKQRAAKSYALKPKRSSPEEKAKKQRSSSDSSAILHPIPNPESRIPESRYQIPESRTNTEEVATGPNGGPSPSRRTWTAYQEAYRKQYGVDPVRNAKVNGQITQLVQRLGEADAPKVAAWFLGHRGAWYVKELHSVGVLLRDCEKLHTEWVTGKQIHDRDVREVDRISADRAMWDRIGERIEAKQNETR